MGDLLTPVKTVRKAVNRYEGVETLSLKEPGLHDPVDTRSEIDLRASDREEPGPSAFIPDVHLQRSAVSGQLILRPQNQENNSVSGPSLQNSSLAGASTVALPDDATKMLRLQPSLEVLRAVFEFLYDGMHGKHEFDVRTIGPQSAQIMNVLVSTTLPDLWPNLRQRELSSSEAFIKDTMLQILRSVSGIGTLTSQLRQLLGGERPESAEAALVDTLQVLAEVLKVQNIVSKLLEDWQHLHDRALQGRLFWHEVTSLIAGGKVMGVAAQALRLINDGDEAISATRWLGDNKQYCGWLAKNIVFAAKNLKKEEQDKCALVSQFLKRALNLGSRDVIVTEIYSSLLLKSPTKMNLFKKLLENMSTFDQKAVFDAVLNDLNGKLFSGNPALSFDIGEDLRKRIGSSATLLSGITQNNEILESYVEELLVTSDAKAAGLSLGLRRSLVLLYDDSEEGISTLLERALNNFGDKLRIKHNSSLQQEGCAQTILLLVGRLRDAERSILRQPSISGPLMRAVSNRLASSNPQARFLGMVVGTAVSHAVDQPGQELDFDVEDMKSEAARRWLRLAHVHDEMFSVLELSTIVNELSSNRTHPKLKDPARRAVKTNSRMTESRIISIEEVEDDPDEADDLIPYRKPDSDPDDSDEDPTLINRTKPSAPVYIIDLIRQLDTHDKPEIVALALRTAPSLIRRKANFGTELSDHVTTLATSLINLEDDSSSVSSQLRLDALIACFVSKPNVLGPSLAALYFESDFAISQRTILLTTIGLGSRELAGLTDTTSAMPDTELFPSKRLPAHVLPSGPETTEAQKQDPLSALALSQAQSTIQPLALAAADKLSGPDILKIRKFSSRMDVEKKAEARKQERTKRIPRDLHDSLANAIYLPLCSRAAMVFSSPHATGRGLHSTVLTPILVKMLLQTLTLTLHTLGPTASFYLPTLTHETLLLLRPLHTIPQLGHDPIVLPALLHLLLALIDVTIEAGYTAQERLISDHGLQIAELVNWANKLNETVNIPVVSEPGEGEGGGGSDNSRMMPWTVLAAGIQVKWWEMGKRFQGRMLGLVGDEFDGLLT